jgi:hypothetical protein
MASLLFAALLLTGALQDDEAFAQAQSLYRSGDPVAAEVALGPLLDGTQPPAARARVLLWAAMCADMSGRMQVAEERAAAAVALDPGVRLPAEMSLRLAKLVEAVRAEVTTPQSAAAAPSAPATPAGTAAVAPTASQPAPSAPPVPEASPSAPPAPEAAPSAQPPETTSQAAAATSVEVNQKVEVQAGPPPEEEATITVSTSLWAVAGGALTVTMLLGTGAAVIGIYAGLTYYETLAPDAMDVDVTQAAVLDALQLAGILAAGAAVVGLGAAGAAGIAWWVDQE